MRKFLCVFLGAAICTAALCGCGSAQNNGSDGASQNGAATADEPVTETTVSTTGNKLHITDNALGDIWITELEGVKRNSLSVENFTADQNYKERVLEYINAAHDAGLKVGCYFFSQATTNEEAIEEADYVKEILGDVTLEYPVAYDWEIIKDDSARTDTVSSTQATECARAFCTRIKELGYKPMIYSPSRELYFKYDLTRLADFDIWYCEYSNLPAFYYQFTMWQYSENGEVDGIEGAVDLNVCFTGISDYE